ncbi:hypothetical protein KFE25_003513 [Diacronema lutheri]|uniref:Coenzyme Q-binding protein COQ10 START domain-containing protein n=2 Tax=Diacronema lutheri TaxID=2081491 RepID=A0A8J6CC65_DIALT|nr:hypothetical protein KFE25_003513 [Diacronema lutheri]
MLARFGAPVALLLLAATAQAKWLRTSASQHIRAPVGQTYRAWRDLARMPEWSPVSRVDVDPKTGDSLWHLGYRGLEVTWEARVVTEEYPTLLCWESTLGVPNRGEVRFASVPALAGGAGPDTSAADEWCTMALTMSYQIPERISRLVESGAVQTFIVRVCLEPTMRQFCDAMEAEAEAARARSAARASGRAPAAVHTPPRACGALNAKD